MLQTRTRKPSQKSEALASTPSAQTPSAVLTPVALPLGDGVEKLVSEATAAIDAVLSENSAVFLEQRKQLAGE